MVGFWKEVTLAEGKVMMNSNKSLKISPEHIHSSSPAPSTYIISKQEER